MKCQMPHSHRSQIKLSWVDSSCFWPNGLMSNTASNSAPHVVYIHDTMEGEGEIFLILSRVSVSSIARGTFMHR